jgi:hypothetical protein
LGILCRVGLKHITGLQLYLEQFGCVGRFGGLGRQYQFFRPSGRNLRGGEPMTGPLMIVLLNRLSGENKQCL